MCDSLISNDFQFTLSSEEQNKTLFENKAIIKIQKFISQDQNLILICSLRSKGMGELADS
jgi:hypothetical protein